MEFSKREKEITVELAIDLIGAIWYFSAILALPMASVKDLAGTVLGIIGFAIVASIVATIIINKQHGEEPLDERDWAIDARAFKVGFYTLIVLVAMFAGQVFMNTMEWSASYQMERLLAEPMFLANIMLGMIVLSFIIKAAVQLYLYRRGGPDQ